MKKIKKITSIKQIKSIRPDIAHKAVRSLHDRISKVEAGAKLPKYGDQRLPAPRRKAVRKYKTLAETIQKIPKRNPKASPTERLQRLETKIKHSTKQPKGVVYGHRKPVLSKPQAKALKKLGGDVSAHKPPIDTKKRLPGRGTPERSLLAKKKLDMLKDKKQRRFNNKMNVHLYRNKKGTALGRPEKLKSLLNRRKANKNLYQGLEGL